MSYDAWKLMAPEDVRPLLPVIDPDDDGADEAYERERDDER